MAGFDEDQNTSEEVFVEDVVLDVVGVVFNAKATIKVNEVPKYRDQFAIIT